MSKDQILLAAITCCAGVPDKCLVCPMGEIEDCKERLILAVRDELGMECLKDVLSGQRQKWPEGAAILLESVLALCDRIDIDKGMEGRDPMSEADIGKTELMLATLYCIKDSSCEACPLYKLDGCMKKLLEWHTRRFVLEMLDRNEGDAKNAKGKNDG